MNLESLAAGIDGRAIKVIGLGGIGAPVAQGLAQFCAFRGRRSTLWLIDGDAYEDRNRERVLFDSAGENKAVAKARELAAMFGESLAVVPAPRYVTPRNVHRIVEENDVVFLCVDNHASRRPVSNRCRKLKRVALFSGGNDDLEDGRSGTFGNVQIYIREGGRDRTSPLTRHHPEIAKPRDQRPDELGCAALAQAAPQLLFTNLAVAAALLGSFYAWLAGTLDWEEVYLDISRGKMTPVKRRL